MRKRKIAVIYHSQSAGNTTAAAEQVAKGIAEAGDFEIFAVNTNDARVRPSVLEDCSGVAFGSPDYFSYPAGGLKMFIDDWLIAQRAGNEKIKGMPVALFLTHGGGGAAQAPLEDLFRHIGPQVGSTLAIKGRPGSAEAAQCRALGAELARKAREFLEKGE